jgi:glycosyltransferase involved in cell wall biosynthesis
MHVTTLNPTPKGPLVIDGVFFQLNSTGIAKMWESLLAEWAQSPFAQHIVLLDRAHTAPKFSTIRTIPIEPFVSAAWQEDRVRIQNICTDVGAALFTSTYYTIPVTTPMTLMVYDLIPEVLKWDVSTNTDVQERNRAVAYSKKMICISHNTRKDLLHYYQSVTAEQTSVVHCGLDHASFYPRDAAQIQAFRARHGVTRPYFILSGLALMTYKNGKMFFEALSATSFRKEVDVVVTGRNLHPNERELLKQHFNVIHVSLSTDEMAAALSGSMALIVPSLYEGFGMPMIEAMACGCPVISTPFGSLREVGGDAALYVEDTLPLAQALIYIQNQELRRDLCTRGLAQAHRYSWKHASKQLEELFLAAMS